MSNTIPDRQSLNEYVGRTIRNLRQSQNITLIELADRLNLSYQQVQKYETGTNRVGADMLFEIASALKTDIASFFPFSGMSQNYSPEQMRVLHSYEAIGDRKTKEIIGQLISQLAKN